MINEEVLRSVLQTHTDLIYNILKREEEGKTVIDKEKIALLEQYREVIQEKISERLISS